MIRTFLLSLLLLFFAYSALSATPTQGLVVADQPIDWDVQGNIVERKALFALKTNLLYDVVSALNIAAEISVTSSCSICVEWVFPWWLDSKHNRCFETLYAELQCRYWIGGHETPSQLLGWFVGGYFGGGYCDLQRNYKGVQGEFMGGGVCGGYTHKVWRDLRIEYQLGVGVIATSYDKYDVVLDCQSYTRLLRGQSGSHTWWGPTKVGVSLVWMLNKNIRE